MQQIKQYNRLNNIELQGIPETSNENLKSMVITIGNYLNCNVDPNTIDTVFRVFFLM